MSIRIKLAVLIFISLIGAALADGIDNNNNLGSQSGHDAIKQKK